MANKYYFCVVEVLQNLHEALIIKMLNLLFTQVRVWYFVDEAHPSDFPKHHATLLQQLRKYGEEHEGTASEAVA